jgi:starvation-inducible DNA-binding protein
MPPANPEAATRGDTMAKPKKIVVKDLQSTLVELVDLSLLGKQAHWNVVGSHFRSIHLQLDEIVDIARLSSDRVAERLATIGASPDGRAETVATGSELAPFPEGFVAGTDTVKLVTAAMETIADRMRERIGRIGEDDPVSQDILIGISDEVEKAAWMLRAQLEL